MPRFTLTWLLMFTALVGIVVTFTQTEGCGRRMTLIDSVEFSSDDSHILVSKLNARDARVPMKRYKANLARTVSWLDADDGRTLEVVRQDHEAGIHGSLIMDWESKQMSVALDPLTDHLAMTEFGGGTLTLDADQTKPVVVPLDFPVSRVSFSKTGRYLAASSVIGVVSVWDTQTSASIMQLDATNTEPFLLSRPQLLFTEDESRLIVADRDSIVAFEIAAMKRSTILTSSNVSPTYESLGFHSVAIAPDDTLIVCSDRWIRRYDLTGEVLAEIEQGQKHYYGCVSADGKTLAVANNKEVKLFDLDTYSRTNTVAWTSASTLALSSDGTKLAIGGRLGGVALADTKTAKVDWYVIPPGRYRWPWTIPAVLLAVWLVVGFGLWRRGKTTKDRNRNGESRNK